MPGAFPGVVEFEINQLIEMNYSNEIKQRAAKIFAENYVGHLMPVKPVAPASTRLASASTDARVRLKIS